MSSRLSNVVKSILFLSGKPVEQKFIQEKLGVTAKEMRDAVSEIMEEFSGENGINLLRFNGKLQFATNPDYSNEVEQVLNLIREKELTNAMLETLAIIAYKQPATRLDIEEVRTVDSTYAIQNLTRLGLIEAVGRKDTIGHPVLFATTDEFLKRFSIGDVSELPDYETLLQKLKDISENGGKITEKPMFDATTDVKDSAATVAETADVQDIPAQEPLPEFLQGEAVETIE